MRLDGYVFNDEGGIYLRLDGHIFNDEGYGLENDYIQDLFFEFLDANGLCFSGILYNEEDGEDVD